MADIWNGKLELSYEVRWSDSYMPEGQFELLQKKHYRPVKA